MQNNTMEDIINIGTFMEHLTYFIKMGIYVNKGTDKEQILETSIKLYNKLKKIETSSKTSEDEESFVRRCLKRVNLILKIDDQGDPISIKNKDNQLKLALFREHPAIQNNKMELMIKYLETHPIDILTGLPLSFLLRESKYQELIWQYLRSMFYISQVILCQMGDSTEIPTLVNMKKEIVDKSIDKLTDILTSISDLEEQIKMNQLMAVDNFLNCKLLKVGINEKNVNEAKMEVKEMFQKKGLGDETPLGKMVDLISDNLTNIDLNGGNLLRDMYTIAQNVANEMKGDIEQNPQDFQNTIMSITQVFQEAMNSDSNISKELPPELRETFSTIINSACLENPENEVNSEELMKTLESLVQTHGLDRGQLLSSLKGVDGTIDVKMVESLLAKNFK